MPKRSQLAKTTVQTKQESRKGIYSWRFITASQMNFTKLRARAWLNID